MDKNIGFLIQIIHSFPINKKAFRNETLLLQYIYLISRRNPLLGQAVDFSCQFAFQISRFILVNYPFLSQFINLGSHGGQFFTSFLLHFDYPQITDCVAGCLTIVAVAIPAFICLAHILFCSLVICHELGIFGRQR